MPQTKDSTLTDVALARRPWFFPAEMLRRRLDDVDAVALRRRIEDAGLKRCGRRRR